MMHELFFEIRCEEIPARLLPQAEADMAQVLSRCLENTGLAFADVRTCITPLRMTFAADIAPAVPAVSESRRGPRLGAPQAALDGFMNANGLGKEQLREENGYWYADLHRPAQPSDTLLPAIILNVLRDFPWPRAMTWPGSRMPWIRPVRAVYCVYNGAVQSFGLPDLGLHTVPTVTGHRFLNPQEITPQTFADYLAGLVQLQVIADRKERARLIHKELARLAGERGLTVIEDPGLTDEVSGLCEYPFTALGEIGQEFMSLPEAVLRTSMRVHQKYFSFQDAQGKAAPVFGVVANVPVTANMTGNFAKVLKARLSDARFFYETDLRVRLEDIDVSNIVFQERLGSMAQKCIRLERICALEQSRQAARLAKADLKTNMVGEFAELQGIMGEIYARAQGYPEHTAVALREYYRPQGLQDECPQSLCGRDLAVADRIDTLAGFFAIGLKPTGSKDPYALRRAAIGIIRIAATDAQLPPDQRLDISLDERIAAAVQAYARQGLTVGAQAMEELKAFIGERLTVYLKDKGTDPVFLQAILQRRSLDRLFEDMTSVNALKDFSETSYGMEFLKALKRLAGVRDPKVTGDPDRARLFPPALHLLDTVAAAGQNIDVTQQDTCARITGAANDFLDNVMVLDPDDALREANLQLINHLIGKVCWQADYTLLV